MFMLTCQITLSAFLKSVHYSRLTAWVLILGFFGLQAAEVCCGDGCCDDNVGT